MAFVGGFLGMATLMLIANTGKSDQASQAHRVSSNSSHNNNQALVNSWVGGRELDNDFAQEARSQNGGTAQQQEARRLNEQALKQRELKPEKVIVVSSRRKEKRTPADEAILRLRMQG